MNTSIRKRVANLDFWSSQVKPEPLSGGITNTNFFVDDHGKKFVVNVPSGTNGDSRLRIKGQGLPSGPIGDRGDLYVKIGVKVPKKTTDEQKDLIESLNKAGL